MKRTQGPWIVVKEDVTQMSDGIIVGSLNGYEVRPLGQQPLGEELLDLALIQQAPELLEQLETLVKKVQNHMVHGTSLDTQDLFLAKRVIYQARKPIDLDSNAEAYQKQWDERLHFSEE
jgi:hypothetical protein